ncbi:MAG: UDP-N-acetylglucosamine 1-carboxyvinyltransferase, partial [Paludibacteraceae bacterium]|nr:UDP-N-acetylglucosamine 1-carboxyvinyltransferase [Paludibacteraceae bacterium]
MASFVIEGGHRLSGSITPQGAKNEALQVICATLLTSDEVTINNIPDIADVNNLIELISNMGVKVNRLSRHSCVFKAENINFDYLRTQEYRIKSSNLRGSIMLVGPILARFGKALIPQPGGDKIGRRRLDTHFEGFVHLGAEFNYDAENRLYNVSCKELKGCYMLLDEASVT